MVEDAGTLLGAASAAHLLFSTLLILMGRQQLVDRELANAILIVSLLMAVASVRFLIASEAHGDLDLWYDVLNDGGVVLATSWLLAIIDHHKGAPGPLRPAWWPVAILLAGWALPAVRHADDLRVLLENAVLLGIFGRALWIIHTADPDFRLTLRPTAAVSLLGLFCAVGAGGVTLGRLAALPAALQVPSQVSCEAPVLILAFTLPLVLFTLLREHEARLIGLGQALSLQRRVADLKAAEARIHLAQGIAGVGTYEFDAQRGEIILPPSTRDLLGLPAAGVVTLADMRQRVAPATAPALDQLVQSLAGPSAADGTTTAEFMILHPERGHRLVSCVGSRISGVAGLAPTITGAVIDITDRRAAEQRVFHTAQLAKLGEVAAGVAHELRQPLNAIKIGVSNVGRMLSNASADAGDLQGRLVRISRSVDRADGIIEAMRKLARDRSDQWTIFDAGGAVHDALVLQTEAARLKGVEIAVSVTPDLRIKGDPARLEQAIFNLVSNAVYAVSETPSSREASALVDICLSEAGNEIEIVVADNGPGLAADVEARLFQAFNTNKPSGVGTGLGLSIVHAIIVREFQGSVTATSSAKGTRFVIRLPKAPTSNQMPPAPARPMAPPALPATPSIAAFAML